MFLIIVPTFFPQKTYLTYMFCNSKRYSILMHIENQYIMNPKPSTEIIEK